MTDTELAEILWAYMRYEHPLEKADVIIGLGSSDLRTAKHAAQLYGAAWAPTVLFSGGRGRFNGGFQGSEGENYDDIAINQGVPIEAIFLESLSTNTGENIVYSYELLREMHKLPRIIILVTKPYMLRRAYATFMKQRPGTSVKVLCSAINESFSEYTKDESVSEVINIMVGDLQRIYDYPALGYQISQKVPPEVDQAYKELVERGYIEHLIR